MLGLLAACLWIGSILAEDFYPVIILDQQQEFTTWRYEYRAGHVCSGVGEMRCNSGWTCLDRSNDFRLKCEMLPTGNLYCYGGCLTLNLVFENPDTLIVSTGIEMSEFIWFYASRVVE